MSYHSNYVSQYLISETGQLIVLKDNTELIPDLLGTTFRHKNQKVVVAMATCTQMSTASYDTFEDTHAFTCML